MNYNSQTAPCIALQKLENVKHSSGGWQSARCPLCEDEGADKKGTNLAISPDEQFLVCHRNEEHGFEVKKLLEVKGQPSFKIRKKPSYKPRTKPTASELLKARCYCEYLAGNEQLRERIAEARNWKPETLRYLANHLDLGFSDTGEIAFIYSNGLKLRGKKRGNRTFRWVYGGNGELWRSSWIELNNPKRVWITEGETDAITLIDKGFDNYKNGDLVLAMPGATTWNSNWSALLKCCEVVFVPDHDRAGIKGLEKAVNTLMREGIENVRIWKWK